MSNPVRTIVLLFLAARGAAAWAADDLPAPDELVARVPRLSTEGTTLRSFEVGGTLILNASPLEFLVSVNRPEQVAVRLSDGRDHAPLLVAAGGTFMMYDPLAEEILLGTGVPVFRLGVEASADTTSADKTSADEAAVGEAEDAEADRDRSFVFGLGIGRRPDAADSEAVAEAMAGVSLDLRSVAESATEDRRVERRPEGYVLTGTTPRGNRGVITFAEQDGVLVCTAIELFSSGPEGDRLFCRMDRISIGHPPVADRFRFPEPALRNAGLTIRRPPDRGVVQTALSVGRFVRAVMARLALSGVDEMKAGVQAMTREPIDWEIVRERDARVSAVLLGVFPPDANGAR